jgi:hypothetical protein
MRTTQRALLDRGKRLLDDVDELTRDRGFA